MVVSRSLNGDCVRGSLTANADARGFGFEGSPKILARCLGIGRASSTKMQAISDTVFLNRTGGYRIEVVLVRTEELLWAVAENGE